MARLVVFDGREMAAFNIAIALITEICLFISAIVETTHGPEYQ